MPSGPSRMQLFRVRMHRPDPVLASAAGIPSGCAAPKLLTRYSTVSSGPSPGLVPCCSTGKPCDCVALILLEALLLLLLLLLPLLNWGLSASQGSAAGALIWSCGSLRCSRMLAELTEEPGESVSMTDSPDVV